MTVREAIQKFDTLCDQCYERDLLIWWLAELDYMAIQEVFSGYDGDPTPDPWLPSVYETDLSTQLLIPAPYDGVYLEFLRMKCDDWNKEKNYTNSAKAFNNTYATFGDYWRRTHRKKQPCLRV